MYTYKDLTHTSIEVIHDCFLDAFSEYEVDIAMPLEKLEEMMLTRSYDASYSLGCFDEDQLVGICLTGSRYIDGQHCGYDVATGIRQAYQGKGIAKEMLVGLKEILRNHQVKTFFLEVLENNKPAQSVYEKSGFEITRRLKCYTCKTVLNSVSIEGLTISNDPALLAGIDEKTYVGYQPTWQNSFKAYEAVLDQHEVILLQDASQVVGYLIIHRSAANILQLGVHPNFDYLMVGKQLITAMDQQIKAPKYSILNVEDEATANTLFEAVGFQNYINQFEMAMVL